MNIDLAIINGTIVDEHGSRRADIGIVNGQVAMLVLPGALPPATTTLDAQDLMVLPGFVDAHFHCRAPDAPQREDFASGTSAAAAGGVTTLFEMPIAHRSVSTPEVVREREALIEQHAYIDVGLFGAGGTLDADATLALADSGVIGFKIFTHRAAPNRRAAFADLSVLNERDLYRALEMIETTGLPCAVHAENDQLLELFADVVTASVPGSVDAYMDSRPTSVEAMAIAQLAILAEATGAHVHIVHVTSAWALDIIRTARRRGVHITAETCPQYLLFDENTARTFGAWAKIAPPLRTAEDCAALWAALADGTIDLVASDHAPFTPDDKQSVELQNAPSGMPNVEAAAPLLLSAALEGKLPFHRMVGLLTAGPARVYGSVPPQGCARCRLGRGPHALRPQCHHHHRYRHLATRSKGSAQVFDGVRYRGSIHTTIVRGAVVYQDGRITGTRGWGKPVHPNTSYAKGTTMTRESIVSRWSDDRAGTTSVWLPDRWHAGSANRSSDSLPDRAWRRGRPDGVPRIDPAWLGTDGSRNHSSCHA